MAGENEASGATQSEATQGDPAVPAGAVAAEAGAGADAASDARAEADRARDEYIAQLAADAATRAVEAAISRMQQSAPQAAAATPPTASQGAVAELEAEGRAIQAERNRLQQAIARDGYTGENIVARADLAERASNFTAQVTMLGLQQSEQNRTIDKHGAEKEWQDFARANPNTPMDILRDAFDARQAKAAANGGKLAPKLAAPARPSVNVSAPGEVTAGERKARTMTQDQVTSHRNALKDRDDDDAVRELADFDRKLRSREIIKKG